MGLGVVASSIQPSLIVSVHSFNPIYEGQVRDFAVGVLSTTNDALALEASCMCEGRLENPRS